MEWLLFAGLIAGNFLTFGTIKVVKDNKTREFSLGKVVNYLSERYKALKDPLEDHNKYLEQQAKQAREETDKLLEPYDHALRNIEEENRIEEQKITKIEKIIEAEKRKKELHESVKKLSEAAREFGISLEEIEEGRETIAGGIGGSRQVYTYDPIKYEPKTQDWINTKIKTHNQPINEKKILRNLDDIVERINKEDKRPLKQIDKIARNPEALKKILKHHKPNTFKYEIASKIFMIVMYELSYEDIVTDFMQQTFISVSAATNLESEVWSEYFDITGLRSVLRRYQTPEFISIHSHTPHGTWREKEQLREEINRWKEMPF